jgi:transposase
VIGLSPSGVKVMVATKPVDFRRGMNGLVALVASALRLIPIAETCSCSAPSVSIDFAAFIGTDQA